MIYAIMLCLGTLCSDDMLGVIGNERICWDAVEYADVYQVAYDGKLCLQITAGATCVDLPAYCRGDQIRVRACNHVGCGGFSEPIEVLPFACIVGKGCTVSGDVKIPNESCPVCEVPCFEGAPLHKIPNVPACEVTP